MGELRTIIVIILFWILSFVEPSGWSIMLDLPIKANWMIAAMALLLYYKHAETRPEISKKLFWGVIISFIVIPYLYADSFEGASYLVAFLTVYIISTGSITPRIIRLTGLSIAAMGLVVLYIYATGTMLSGWNDNAIAMVGLFSFIYFSIFLIEKKGKRSFWFWNTVTLAYILLLFGTDCRSGMLFTMITVAGIIFSSLAKRLIENSRYEMLILNLPLIIAFIVIAISSSSYYDELEMWSIQKFDKTIFNGRNGLWEYALTLLEQSSYLGTGKFEINYHNSGVAAISVFGILGYICWIGYFSRSLKNLKKFMRDDIVFGSILAFSLIFMQQALDLGFISPVPNLLPYIILGVGIGRVNQLKKEECNP